MNLLVENINIHHELTKRWEELELKSAFIIKDAKERGMEITNASLSRYRSAVVKDKKGEIKKIDFKRTFTTEQLMFLCARWGIRVNIVIGEPNCENLQFKVLPYDELSALRRVAKMFPNLKTNA